MIYLEQEVKLVGNDEWDIPESLEYSDEFIDMHFNLDEADNTNDFSNLDLLLGVQSWRRDVFTDEWNWVPYETQNFLVTEPMMCFEPWVPYFEDDIFFDNWAWEEDVWYEPMAFDMDVAWEEDIAFGEPEIAFDMDMGGGFEGFREDSFQEITDDFSQD